MQDNLIRKMSFEQKKEAKLFYEQLLAENPQHPDGLHLLGLTLLQSGDPAAAAVWFRTLPPGPTQRLALDNILTEWGRRDAPAAAAFVLSLPPDRTQHAAAVHLATLVLRHQLEAAVVHIVG